MDKIPVANRSTFSTYTYTYANSGCSKISGDSNNNKTDISSCFVNSNEILDKRTDKVYGKVWIANRDLEKGDLLFDRQCLMVFPRLPTPLEKVLADVDDEEGNVNICLGCCQMTKSLCPLCGWPLHRFQCRKWAADQHLEECVIFQQFHIDFEDYRRNPHTYDLIAVLRMCLLKSNKATRTIWNNLLKLRIRFPRTDFHYGSLMTNFLLGCCKLKNIADKEINSLIGVLHANSFSIQRVDTCSKSIYASFFLTKTAEDSDVKIFPVPHSCIPNTIMVYSKQRMLFLALRKIRKNEMLTINYLDIPGAFLWLSKSDRKIYLKKRYYEKPCNCYLCNLNFSSQIELTSWEDEEFCLSRSLKCQNCQNDMVLNRTETKWICRKRRCGAFLDKQQGLEIEIKAEKLLFSKEKLEMNDVLKKIALCQQYLNPCHRILHRKSLEVLKNISDTLLYFMTQEDLPILKMPPDTIANIQNMCRHIFQVEFEFSRKSNEPSFSLALSMVIGTYLELITAEKAMQSNVKLGNLSQMVNEMSHRLYMGLHCLWNRYFTSESDSQFCQKLSNSCYRRLQSVKSKLKMTT